jgi:integrative and conjugative element protein (TIGR02256 family)
MRPLINKKSRPLLIDSDVLEFIEKEAAKAVRTETGGILAGTGSLRNLDAKVGRASGPGPTARRTLFFFARDTNYCQALLNRWAAHSGGEVDYLGEWHKHHEIVPRPSRRDIITCSEIAADANYHVDRCLLLIIGKSNDRTSLRAFIVYDTGKVAEMRWEVLPPRKGKSKERREEEMKNREREVSMYFLDGTDDK